MAKSKYDDQGTLHKKTEKLLRDDGRSMPEIFKATGVPYYWLVNFAAGSYKNPSVNRVQFLYEKLTGKKLNV